MFLATVRTAAVAALLILPGAAAPLAASTLAESARTLASEHGEAIIQLEVVQEISFSFGGDSRSQESKERVNGLVVASDGTVVAALSSVDSAAILSRLDPEMAAMYSSELKSVSYILANGDEVEAMVVLRDPDIDLAVLRPREAGEREFAGIPLDDAPSLDLLDEVFAASRAGRIANRTMLLRRGEVIGMIERPRLFYIPSATLQESGPGSAIFDSEGRLVGLQLLRTLQSAPDGETPAMMVIIPVDEIADIVEQAEED